MKTKKHYFLLFAGALLFVALTGLSTKMGYIFEKRSHFFKPFVQLIEDEPEAEECTPELCGTLQEGSSDTETKTNKCDKDTWTCGSWTACAVDGTQTRKCTLVDDCKDIENVTPSQTQKCTYQKPQQKPTPPPPPPPAQIEPDAELQPAVEGDQESGLKPAGEETPPSNDEPSSKDNADSGTPSSESDAAGDQSNEDATGGDGAATGDENSVENIKAIVNDIFKAPQFQAALIVAQKEAEAALQKDEGEAVAEDLAKDPEFKKIMEKAGASLDLFSTDAAGEETRQVLNTDKNKNGIPDAVEKAAGLPVDVVDQQEVRLQAAQKVRVETLIKTGLPAAEAEQKVKKEFDLLRTERKIELIREVARKQFDRNINKNTDDFNSDGISDEVAVSMGLPPAQEISDDEFSQAELKLYNTTQNLKEKKCTTNMSSGYAVSAKGFTVLAACPRNKLFTLYAIDKNGNEIKIETKRSSENNKIIFAVQKQLLAPGRYLFQIRSEEKGKKTGFGWFLDTALAALEDSEASNFSLIDVTPEQKLETPVVQNIQGVKLKNLSNITVESREDGRVSVSGIADSSVMVVGAFQSAIFTSALLADVQSGSFEVTSAKPLEEGEHDVVIYATKPEEKIQSTPVALHFSIVKTAKAATTQQRGVSPQKTAAASDGENSFPIVPVALGGVVIVIALIITVVARRRKNTSTV